MEKRKNLAERYTDEMTVVDVGLMKSAMLSLGVLIGLFVQKENRKKVVACSSALFLFSYIPLFMKYSVIFMEECRSFYQRITGLKK